jgi:hypothetical protein
MSTTPNHMLLINVITTNICVNRTTRGVEYRKAARGGSVINLRGTSMGILLPPSCTGEHENDI